MPDIPIVVITGGPCGGKSTFLARAREWLEGFGMYAVVVPETATELIIAGASPALLEVEAFQEQLFLYTLDRERHYRALAQKMKAKQVVILCDRGALDCAAYMGHDTYQQMIARLGYSQNELLSRYHLVVHIVSAAVGAEEFYTLENNVARSESIEEARELEFATQRAWIEHPHQILIDNTTDFDTKMMRALRALARKLHMPEPTEIERKFRVDNFIPELIPEGAVAFEITQDYLTSEDEMERRVRKRVREDGEASYFYTEKTPTTESGTRGERERQIGEEEYLRLLCDRDPNRRTIMKTRYKFVFKGKVFELDVFAGAHASLVLLEVELQARDEAVDLPDGWELEEVTDDPMYKNHALAQK